MTDQQFWLEARKRLLLPDGGKINLNAGTLWPTPIPVLEAVTELRREMAARPTDFLVRRTPVLIQESRARLAEYLHCDASNLLLLPNITYAVNIITSSLRLPAGSEIVTTDHEYGAMMYCWRRLELRDNLKIRKIELPFRNEDPGEIVDAISHEINDRTRVLFFSHVTSTTGLVLPAKQLCDLARQRGLISIVDGAHAPGLIPLNLTDLRADFYAANCHKWLMAPAGTGFLHVAHDRKPLLAPLITSWGSGYHPDQAEQDSQMGGTFWQRDFEFHGTVDRCAQMVLPQVMDFRASLGGDEVIHRRTRELSKHTRSALAACGLACVTPENESLNGGALTAFDFPCDDPNKWGDRIWNEHHIECPVTTAADKSFLRVSTGWFNTVEEIDRLASAVRK